MASVFYTDFGSPDAAMEYCRAHENTHLIIPEGDYEITSPPAVEAMEHVIRGDWGSNPQRVMFNRNYVYARGMDLSGQKGTVIEAYGARFMVKGFMEVVTVADCENVTIGGLTIDHVRKPYSYGKVTKCSGSEIEITLDKSCRVEKGTPVALRYIFYDPETQKHIRFRLSDIRVADAYHISAKSEDPVREGMEFYTVHTFHSRPAILLERSKNIRLSDVTIHSMCGMGIVGNRCEDIDIERLHVIPSRGQHFSTNTDATHFTACKGRLRIADSEFEAQGDDFTNIHAYYQQVVGQVGENTYLIQEKTPDGTHTQTPDYPDVGDVLELTDFSTLGCLGRRRVIGCEMLYDKYMAKVTLDAPLPATDGLLLSDITRLPYVEIEGCTSKSHFARGVLLKTRGARVRGNTFTETQGPAIECAAEARWQEGVCPADIEICGNNIYGCATKFGKASGIVVMADCDTPTGQSIFNIKIEDNTILCPESAHGIYCRNVDGLTVSGNRISAKAQEIVIEDCSNVKTDAFV